MSHIMEDDNGNEITVYTAEEIEAAKAAEAARLQADFDAKMADKETHMKKKLDEFQTGKTAQELKDIERDNQIAEAKRVAEEAVGKVTASETRRIDTLKNIAREKFTGNDPELTKKFEEGWGLVNLEIKDDADIARKAELVANLAGLNQNTSGGYGGSPELGGGYAPNFIKQADEKAKEEAHNTFKDALGLGDFINEVKGN